jgi:acyl carrier protein
MNLDELEQFRSQNLQEGTCEIGKKDDEEFEAVETDATMNDKLLDECVTKVLKHLYGKNWDTSVKEKSRKKIRDLISKTLQLDVVEQTESDLGDTLDLLEDSLFLLERIMARHSHTHLAVEMVNHMESVADHLQQWGMGDSKKAETRVLTDQAVTDVMRDRFRD